MELLQSEVRYPQIQTRNRPSVFEFLQFKRKRRPVVLPDIMAKWRALGWNWETLRSRYGATTVAVSRYESGWYKAANVKEMRLDQFLDEMLAGDWRSFPFYVRDSWSFFETHPHLLQDCPIPPQFFDWSSKVPGLAWPGPRLFMGPAGAVTPLHVDIWETHAWLTQVLGRKRWVLLSPEDCKLLESARMPGKGLARYAVDPGSPEFRERFPDVHPIEWTLGPGETIFVPSGWAHCVKSLDPTLSICSNFIGPGAWTAAWRTIQSRFHF